MRYISTSMMAAYLSSRSASTASMLATFPSRLAKLADLGLRRESDLTIW